MRIVKQGSKKLIDDENEVADAVTLAGDGTEKEKKVNTMLKERMIIFVDKDNCRKQNIYYIEMSEIDFKGRKLL